MILEHLLFTGLDGLDSGAAGHGHAFITYAEQTFNQLRR